MDSYDRTATVFPTEQARKKYLEKHPNADPSNHKVQKGGPSHAPKKVEKGTRIKSDGASLTVQDSLDDNWAVAQDAKGQYVVCQRDPHTQKWKSLDSSKARYEALEKARGLMKGKTAEYSYDRTARFTGSPEQLFKSMKESVESLLEARVKTRRVQDALSEIASDATGTAFTDNYNDPDIRATAKLLYELDHQIGEAFRSVERMERDLKKKMK